MGGGGRRSRIKMLNACGNSRRDRLTSCYQIDAAKFRRFGGAGMGGAQKLHECGRRLDALPIRRAVLRISRAGLTTRVELALRMRPDQRRDAMPSRQQAWDEAAAHVA